MPEEKTPEKKSTEINVAVAGSNAPAISTSPKGHGKKMMIAGDVVNRATADLPDKQRSAIRWLHSYAVRENLSTEEVGQMLKKPAGQSYSGDSVYQLLTGKRSEQGVSLEPICEAIDRLQKIIEERDTITRADFVHTTLTKKIWKVCEAALIYQKIAFIFGESQIGKTTALIEYQRTHNHGETIYMRLPTRACLGDFLARLARILRINPALSQWDLKARIIAAFDSRMLLIVDEVHQAFSYNPTRGGTGLTVIEFIREIHDIAKCGVVLAGTEVFEAAIQERAHRSIFSQLYLRKLCAVKLPNKPSASNLDDFAAKYGLAPATGDALDLQKIVIRDDGLGVWLTTLQASSRLAVKNARKLTWADVVQAHATIKRLEQA